jgi:hypothetical protein
MRVRHGVQRVLNDAKDQAQRWERIQNAGWPAVREAVGQASGIRAESGGEEQGMSGP